jgi:uncharacterized protein YraI
VGDADQGERRHGGVTFTYCPKSTRAVAAAAARFLLRVYQIRNSGVVPQGQGGARRLLQRRGARGEFDVSHAKRVLIAAALLLSAVSAMAEPAVVESKINLRSGPGPAFGIIAVVAPGTKLDAQKCAGEWCRVQIGRQVGYASRNLLKIGADSYASAVPQAPAAPIESRATLTGPHVWRWNDSDWRNEHWRRPDWHNRMNR